MGGFVPEKKILSWRKFIQGDKKHMNYELVGILLTVVMQALYIAFKIGKFEQKLEMIEKKQDKHNNLIERMVVVEQSCKSAHKRLDEI